MEVKWSSVSYARMGVEFRFQVIFYILDHIVTALFRKYGDRILKIQLGEKTANFTSTRILS